MTEPDRDAILAAAARVLLEDGIAAASRRRIAEAAGVRRREVEEVADDRTALLAEVIATLPFPPNPQRLAQQADAGDTPPLRVLLEVAREALGQPGSSWDPRELQGLSLAAYDPDLAAVVRERLTLRWAAVSRVLAQLRSGGAVDELVDDSAAVLHVIALGIGLSMLAPVAPEQVDERRWLGLAARLLESLAAIDPAGVPAGTPTAFWRVRVSVADTPAAVSRLMRVLALVHASVPLLLSGDRGDGRQVLDMTLEVPTAVDAMGLADALSAVAEQVIVLPGRPADAEDVATRVLDAAADVALRPALAPLTVAHLVLADSWEVTSAAVGEDASASVMRLQWTSDTHVVLRRSGVPFTRVERARASALLRLTGALARVRGDDPPAWLLTTASGLPVLLRLARPEDADGVRALHERSSEASRFQRYFQPMSQWREENLRRLTGGHRGAALVVLVGGQIVGIGNVFPEQPSGGVGGGVAGGAVGGVIGGVAGGVGGVGGVGGAVGGAAGDAAGGGRCEIALLVEDAYQGRGIGSVLLDQLVELARELGFAQAAAYVQVSNERMRAMLRSRGWAVSPDPGVLTVSLTQPPPGPLPRGQLPVVAAPAESSRP